MKTETVTVAIDPSLSPEEQEAQVRHNTQAFLAKVARLNAPKPVRWFSWKPKGLTLPSLPGKPPVQLAARIRSAPHDEPEAVWVHVQIEAGGRTYAAQFPFQRDQLRTMRQKADDFMVAEFRKSLAREMTPPASVAKPPVTKA